MYPEYVIPPATGIMRSVGGFPAQQLPDNFQCTEADAKLIQSFTGGVLTNAALVPPSGEKITGVDSKSAFQPWYVTGPNATGYVGPAVQEMWKWNPINGGGVGNPGSWSGIGTGNVKYNPSAPPAAAVPPPVSSSGDPGTWANTAGANQGFTAEDRAELQDLRRLVVALAKLQNIS